VTHHVNFFVASHLFTFVSASPQRITRFTVLFLLVLCTGMHWYSFFFADSTRVEEFVPEYFISSPEDPFTALRVLIQYDAICVYVATTLWLLYLFRDLQAAGETKASLFMVVVIGSAASTTFGIGTVLVLLWAWRNEILFAKGAVDKKRQ
jgi:hypothetical protein